MAGRWNELYNVAPDVNTNRSRSSDKELTSRVRSVAQIHYSSDNFNRMLPTNSSSSSIGCQQSSYGNFYDFKF